MHYLKQHQPGETSARCTVTSEHMERFIVVVHKRQYCATMNCCVAQLQPEEISVTLQPR
jgi:hypothetical protein